MNLVYKQLSSYKASFDTKILGGLIPRHLFDDYKKKHAGKYRERVYGFSETFYGMLMQATLEDKSEAQAVLLLSQYHEQTKQEIEKTEEENRHRASAETKKKVGRPRISFVTVQKSKRQRLSLNAASYNESKKRFPKELLEEVFVHTTRKEFLNSGASAAWHGHRVMIVDGTTFKTVDTQELREYFVPDIPNNPPPLPIGRIVGLIDYYGGFAADFRISNYQTGELRLLKDMHESIPPGTVLLGDDLYGTFGHFAYCKKRSIDLVVQGKHFHKETIVSQINEHDKIVQWERGAESIFYEEPLREPESIQLRKISITNPSKPEEMIHLYTTLTDERKYRSEDVVALYSCRWDVELCFREIKDIMKLEYTRGMSVEAVHKEIIAHIIAYNIMRRLMQDVFQRNGEDFFSLGTPVQKNDTLGTNGNAYVDRRGRSFSKKSPGRYPEKISEVSKKEKNRKA